jgi:hypothetical protein
VDIVALQISKSTVREKFTDLREVQKRATLISKIVLSRKRARVESLELGQPGFFKKQHRCQ